MNLDEIFLTIGIVGLVVTAVLALQKKMTLSQRAQKLFPRKIDWFIGIIGMMILCYLPIDRTLSIFWAGFWGHIWIANKERY